jgi:CheY-like chemotaxis protein
MGGAVDSHIRILVVEDDAHAARMLARMLREDGYEVDVALDGAMAIQRLTRAPMPDVLVADFKIPFADGMSVAWYARSRSAGIPVVIITGYPEVVARSPGALAPGSVVLSKPLDYGELTRVLQGIAAGSA